MNTLDFGTIDAIRNMGDPSDGDEFVRELLQMFTDQTQLALTEMVAAGARQDVEKVKFLSHRLKGSAANVGAIAVSAQAKLVESAAIAAGAERAIVPAIADLEAIFKITIHDLADFLRAP